MPSELATGVRSAAGSITSADDAALRAATLAESAVLSQTFGVGGLLIDRSGRIWAEALNAVIRDGKVFDPTAHVERQLIDWYFLAKSELSLPPAEDLLIISSLDPCAMCAGAILQSGMNAVAVAEDPVSGVHDEKHLPYRMPQELWGLAEKRLWMFAREGETAPSANQAHFPLKGRVSDEALSRAQGALADSIRRVRALVGDEKPESDFVTIMNFLRTSEAELPRGTFVVPRELEGPAAENLPALSQLLGEDGACIIEGSGCPILFAKSAEASSPIRDGILELIRAYTSLRIGLRKKGLTLPHPRRCSVLTLRAPQSAVRALMDIGALGSFLEERRQPSAFPLLMFVEDTNQPVQRYLASLPPFYTGEIGISVGQLRSELTAPTR